MSPTSRTIKGPFDFRAHWQQLIQRPAFHEPVLDGIRAIAVLWVVLLHMVFFHLGTFTTQALSIFNGPVTPWIKRGDLGVDLFFVLSGFLMGTILLKEWKKTGGILFARFYARRLLRLMPVYVVVMVMGLYLLRNVPKSAILTDMAPSGNAENLWANLLYVNNFVPFAKQYMGWCWSLAIEEQFYLLLPVALLVFLGPGRGRVGLLLAGLFVSGLVQLLIMRTNQFVPPFLDTPDTATWQQRFDTLYDKPYARYGGLLTGVLGAYLTLYHTAAVKRFFAGKRLVAVLSLAALGVMLHVAFTAGPSAMFRALPPWASQLWWALHRDVFSVATMFLILSATYSPELFGGRLRAFLAWKGFYPVAQLSYSIYLVHEMVFLWLFPKLGPVLSDALGGYGTMAADSLVGMLLVFAITAFLYVTVERPSMELRSMPLIRNLGAPKEKLASGIAG